MRKSCIQIQSGEDLCWKRLFSDRWGVNFDFIQQGIAAACRDSRHTIKLVNFDSFSELNFT